jgi:hypothetical protein
MHLKKSHNEGSPVHEAPCLALALLTGSPEIATDKICGLRIFNASNIPGAKR